MGTPHVEEAFAGSLFRVEVLRWPGKRREVVRHPGAAAVVALTGGDEVVLIRQLREAVGERILELPAGIFDVDDEPAETTARRELEEETGYRASSIEPLAMIRPSPGFSDEVIRLFLATADRGGDPEDGIEVVRLTLVDAVAAIEAGEITDGKTIAGLLLAARRRGG